VEVGNEYNHLIAHEEMCCEEEETREAERQKELEKE